jgi:hypothetical protein
MIGISFGTMDFSVVLELHLPPVRYAVEQEPAVPGKNVKRAIDIGNSGRVKK